MEEFKLTRTLPKAQGAAENDHWPTPKLLARRAVEEAVALYSGLGNDRIVFMEPGCGDRAPFLTAAKELGYDFSLVGVEFRPVPIPEHLENAVRWYNGVDFLNFKYVADRMPGFCFVDADRHPDIIVTNPPFAMAREFVERAIDIISPTGLVVMLLQTGIEGSIERRPFWENNMPFMRMVIRPRPSFGGGSDSREYALYFWAGKALDVFLHAIGRNYLETTYLDNSGPWGRE